MKNKSQKRKNAIPLVCVCVVIFIVGWLMFCGYRWAWGPFSSLTNLRYQSFAGNGAAYDLDQVEPLETSPLDGQNICYLGSSVTYGASSLQTSFVEYIAVRNHMTYVKEAVSGTTLVDEGVNSYISRLKKLDTAAKYDLFVCQLSTNDATQHKPLGSVTAEENTDFDTSTVCGAMEYIITYAQKTWNCPVVFYTNAYYENAEYAAMVEALYQLRDKYGIGIIDLYSDKAFNTITDEERSLYMADAIHPTKAGYLLWWVPQMEAVLYGIVEQ